MAKASTSSAAASIQAKEVSKIYGHFAAIQNVSFTVRPNTVAAFLGPNGAGKSTTMKILTGYLAPTTGSVSLIGLDPSDPAQRIVLARFSTRRFMEQETIVE